MQAHHLAHQPPTGVLPPVPDAGTILHALVDVVCVLDGEGVFRYVSAASQQLFGYSPEEMMGASFEQFVYPGDVEKTRQGIADCVHGRPTSHFENRGRRKDGSLVHMIWSGRWDEGDGLLYCVARDGTAKSEIEGRLVKAQQIARVANYEFDLVAGRYTYTSDTIFDIFGIDRTGHPCFTSELFWSRVHPDDRDTVRQSLLQTQGVFSDALEYRIVHPDGRVLYIHRIRELVHDAEGCPVKAVGTLQDITARKLGELERLRNEEQNRMIVEVLEQMRDGFFTLGSGDTVIYWNGEAERLTGIPKERALGHSFWKLYPGMKESPYYDLYLRMGAAREPIQETVYSPFSQKWFELRAYKTPNGISVFFRDVTENKRAEEELQKLSLIARETTNPVIIYDRRQTVQWVNNAFLRLTGYSFEECVGRSIGDILDGPQTDSQIVRYVQQQIDHCEPYRIETLNYKKNGDTYWADVSCQPVFNEGGEVVQYFSIATDITGRKTLERQLEREQRERQNKITAATLKAQEHERSIVSQELHDNVNQVLTTVKLYTEMVRDGVANPEVLLDKSIDLLQASISEIRSLSKRLSAPSLGKIRLAESVKELLDAVAATQKFTVSLDTRAVAHLEVSQDLHLAVYRILQEHLTNVLKHAGAGRVKVTLDTVGGSIRLRVTDDGKGFTPTGKHNGIGIANMITRAESLNGSCSILSAPGKGCELVVRIPL